MQHECNIEKVKHGKSLTWKKCNMEKVQPEKVQHGNSETWKSAT